MESGGLLQYFKGRSDDQRRCLSFCLWVSQEQARAAADGVSHQMAAEISREMYETYELERYHLFFEEGLPSFVPLEHIR